MRKMMAEWNPYENAFERLIQKTDTELCESIHLRLTGREADPEYNWSRNQEPPERFYEWACERGGEGFRKRFGNALRSMIDGCLNNAADPDRVDSISRLLYLAELIKAQEVAELLRQRLRNKGKLNLEVADEFLKMSPAPWAPSLLHQALGALSVIESTMSESDGPPRTFWEALHEYKKVNEKRIYRFASDLRLIALRALGRLNWKKALLDDLKHAIEAFLPKENQNRSEKSLTSDLAALISFFIHESKRQEQEARQKTFCRSGPTLVEEPYPLVPAFKLHAANRSLMSILENALLMLSRSGKVFEGESVGPDEWRVEYIRETMEEICGHAIGCNSIRARVQIAREVANVKQSALIDREPGALPDLLFSLRETQESHCGRSSQIVGFQLDPRQTLTGASV